MSINSNINEKLDRIFQQTLCKQFLLQNLNSFTIYHRMSYTINRMPISKTDLLLFYPKANTIYPNRGCLGIDHSLGLEQAATFGCNQPRAGGPSHPLDEGQSLKQRHYCPKVPLIPSLRPSHPVGTHPEQNNNMWLCQPQNLEKQLLFNFLKGSLNDKGIGNAINEPKNNRFASVPLMFRKQVKPGFTNYLPRGLAQK